MKTRTTTIALLTLLSVTGISATANTGMNNNSGSTYSGNPVSVKCQGMTEVQLLNDGANLNEWSLNMDNWEQEGEVFVSENTLMESNTLEEWVNGRENWEQHSEVIITEVDYSVPAILDQWITGIESWEQE